MEMIKKGYLHYCKGKGYLHYCKDDFDSIEDECGHTRTNYCYEDYDGYFWVKKFTRAEIDHYVIKEPYKVNFCPFCHTKAPKQVEEKIIKVSTNQEYDCFIAAIIKAAAEGNPLDIHFGSLMAFSFYRNKAVEYNFITKKYEITDMIKPIVYSSKYNWKPGMKGSLIAFKIGEKANYRDKDGRIWSIRIESELMSHQDAPGEFVRECYFFDSSEGPCKVAVNADQIEPVFD